VSMILLDEYCITRLQMPASKNSSMHAQSGRLISILIR
jgi:hypothetical protein